MNVGNIRLEVASLWVQIWGAPFDMVSPQVAKEVGSRLGEVEEVEWRKKQDDLNMFMRVRVALPISKPIRRGGFIAGSDGGKSWVSFKYEWLPLFCHYCGILGHDLKHYAAHYAVEKAGGRIEYQYGEFLRAVGGRPRAQGSKAADPKFASEDEKGSAAEKRAVPAAQGGPVETMEAHGYSCENPSVTGKVNAVIQGSRAELAHVDSSQNNTHAHITDTDSVLKETGPKIQQDNQLTSDFTEAEATGVTKIQKGGVHVKSTAIEDQIAEPGINLSNLD